MAKMGPPNKDLLAAGVRVPGDWVPEDERTPVERRVDELLEEARERRGSSITMQDARRFVESLPDRPGFRAGPVMIHRAEVDKLKRLDPSLADEDLSRLFGMPVVIIDESFTFTIE